MAEAASNNARRSFRETVEIMAPETAKIKAEMAAGRLKGGVMGAERKKHNSEEDGNAAKRMKMALAEETPASLGGAGEKFEAADSNAERAVRVMFTNLDKEYVEKLKPQLVAIGIEVRFLAFVFLAGSIFFEISPPMADTLNLT